jgi:16S rRNA (uracil1498-N3)-methyltransferase
MRLHRFYIEQEIIVGQKLTINSTDLVSQIRRFFRLKSGDKIIFFNRTGFDYECNIYNFISGDKMSGDTMITDVIAATQTSGAFLIGKKISLYAAMVKKDTFEWVVEKATELGVTDIIPVMAERSEKKNLNEARIKKISVEASEQSGRDTVPIIHNISSLEDAISNAKSAETILVFHTEGQTFNRSLIADKKSIAVFIGPEGGWSERELEVFHKNGLAVSCLGSQVLRSETAVIAALSQVVFNVI